MRPDQAFNPIRALESAWKILMKAPLPMWVGGLILVVIQSVGGGGWNFRFDHGWNHGAEALMLLLVPIMAIGFTVSVVVSLVVSWLSVGYFNGVATVMRTGEFEFEQLFDARGRWLSMFLTRLLKGFLIVVATMTLAIGPLMGVIVHEVLGLDEGFGVLVGILGFLFFLPLCAYVGLGVMLAPYAAAFEDINPFDAIARSWGLARGNRLMLLVFVVVEIVMAIVGLLMCCVGVLPVGILIEVMWVEAYVQATQVDNFDEWWIRTAHTPPSPVPPTAAAIVAPADLPPEPQVSPEQPPQEPPAPEPGAGGPFDPGAWRDQADIPPIEDEPRN